MAETASDIIKSSLFEIGAADSESPAGPDENSDSIRYLNRMMAKFAVQGINLGYTVVSSLADIITVPDGAIDGIVANLAIRLHPQYSSPDEPISLALAEAADDGYDTMMILGGPTLGETAYPNTVPIGSGNEGDFGCQRHFFGGELDNIELENDGFIAVEESTE